MLEKIVFGVITFVIIVVVGFVSIGSTYFLLKDSGEEDAENRRRACKH